MIRLRSKVVRHEQECVGHPKEEEEDDDDVLASSSSSSSNSSDSSDDDDDAEHDVSDNRHLPGAEKRPAGAAAAAPQQQSHFESIFGLELVVSLRRRGQQRVGTMVNRLGERLRSGVGKFRPLDGAAKNINNNNKSRQRRRRRSLRTFVYNSYSKRVLELSSSRIPHRWCTPLLLISMFIWILVTVREQSQNHYLNQSQLRSSSPRPQEISPAAAAAVGRIPRLDLLQLRKRRAREAKLALGSAAATSATDTNEEQLLPLNGTQQQPQNGDNIDVEALPPECIPSEWQKFSFPNCNEIHEIDLRVALGLSRRGHRNPHPNNGTTNVHQQIGYVGSGMWRTVWKVYPHGPHIMEADGTFGKPAVLKTMKGEHDVDDRNLDRHRRDALVMERLTSSPNIIGIYGFCGNTILSEFVSTGLDRVILDSGDAHNLTSKLTRSTPLGRLQLAMGVAKGVAALHNIPGGPILHADLQAKQFLVDTDGMIKLNDFNRCRFLAHHKETHQPCLVRIPQAPGSARAPEEYEYKPLNEQIDVYSLGHVLYSILTGRYPWEMLSRKAIKANVKSGNKPIVDAKYIVNGTSDGDLVKLMESAYEYDPKTRITATDLVQELEHLMKQYYQAMPKK